MHCQLCIGPDGLEALWPGPASEATFIGDWIRHPGLIKDPVSVGAGDRDLQATLQRNRDVHFGRRVRTITELRLTLQGRPFVIVCPGPSLLDTDMSRIPKDAVVVSLNRAIKYHRPTVAFITERHALLDWTQDDNGVLLPYIPDVPLVTSFDAAGWLADVWPDDKRFYSVLPWSEVPQDPRAKPHIEAGNELFSCMFTPVMAMDFARVMGASRIIMLGADFSMTHEGLYYWDMHASKHCNRHDQIPAFMVPDVRGGSCTTNQFLMYGRNVIEAVAYWIERTARIPVFNCSEGGILDWRVSSLEDQFPLEPDNDPATASPLGQPEAEVHGEMERPQLQAA